MFPLEFFRWNRLIGEPTPMKKLLLEMTENFYADNEARPAKLEEILGIRRKFQSMRVNNRSNNYKFDAGELLKVVSNHGAQIRELFLYRVGLEGADDLIGIFSHLPLLEKLQIAGLKFQKKVSCEKPLRMGKLKEIRCLGNGLYSFECFTAPRLTHLQISGPKQYSKGLENFLAAAVELKTLEIHDWQVIRKVKGHLNLPAFKLEKLLVGEIVKSGAPQFVTFLKTQAASLKDFEIKMFPREILPDIFANISNLRKLKIPASIMDDDKEVFGKLSPFKRLKELRFTMPGCFAMIMTSVQAFLAKCPNLEILDAGTHYNFYTLLPFIVVNNPKLKKMKIRNVAANLGPSEKFKCLTHLEIATVSDLSIMMRFIDNCPSIETLIVNDINLKCLNQFSELKNQLAIRNVKFYIFGEKLRPISETFWGMRRPQNEASGSKFYKSLDGTRYRAM